MADDDLGVLADRPGWTVENDDRAMYWPIPNGWSARVSRVLTPGRSYERFHVALINPAGVAQHTTYATMVSEAWRVAEGWVRSQKPG